MQKHVVKILATLLLVTVVLSGIAVFMASTASNPSLDGVNVNDILMDISIDGEKVNGDSTMFRYEDWIILMAFQYSAGGTYDSSRRTSGTIQLSPITIVKRVDKSSPLLMEGLIERKTIDAIIETVGLNPDADVGKVTQRLTIEQGQIVSMTQTVQIDETGNSVSIDTIQIIYGRLIIEVFENGELASTVSIEANTSGA